MCRLAIIFLTLVTGGMAVGAPVVPVTGIVNGATFQSPGAVAPGELVAVFGTDLATATQLAGTVPLPTSLGGATATIGGVSVPLIYSSPLQINLQIPWELANMTNPQITVQTSSTGAPVTLTVLQSQPGIFTTNQSGSGQGAILIANTASLAAPAGAFPGSRPVQRGEYIEIFSTGLGPVFNTPPSGAVTPDGSSTLVFPPTVTIGGAAATVSFAGLAPGYVGLYQVNVQIPQAASVGNAVPLVLFAGTNANTVTLAVAPQAIPDVTGAYSGTGTATTSRCINPAENGTFSLAVTSIFSQSGNTFTGTLTATTVVQGASVQFIDNISGTVDSLGALSGSLSGDEFINGGYDSSHQGTYTGSLSGNLFSIQTSIQETGGPCQTAASVTVSR